MNIPESNILKWALKALVFIVGCGFIIVGFFYWEASQLRWEWNEKETNTAQERAATVGDISIVMDSSLISRGERLSHTLHCTYCHGENLEGSETSEMVGSNLTKSRHRYSNADLVKVIRSGIKNDDSLIRCCMPFAESYYHLSDRDMKAIIAYIRSLPDLENDDLPAIVGDKSENSFIQETLARIVGGYRHVVHGWTPVYEVTYTPRRSALPTDGPIAYGKYLTQTHCARCHSEDLSGDPGYWQTPDVAVGAGYSSEQFKELLREGKALGDRDIGFMAPFSKEYFSHLTDSEIKAIHSYLQKRANSTSENLNLK